MVLGRVMRSIVERNETKLWKVGNGGRQDRTGWSHLYQKRTTAQYPRLMRDLSAIGGIAGEQRVEALAANLGANLTDVVEEFAVYLLWEVVPPDDRFAALAHELADADVTLDQLRERALRAKDREEGEEEEGSVFMFLRSLTRRRLNPPIYFEGDDRGEVKRQQDELSDRLARVRRSISRLLIRRVEYDLFGGSLTLEWTPEMGEMLARRRFHAVDSDLFRLDAEHLWIDLSVETSL